MASSPENIGDVYKVTGYPSTGEIGYGLAYKDAASVGAPGSLWRIRGWWLEMDDGDCYEWPNGATEPDIPMDSIELVRRNVRPAREISKEAPHDA